MHIAYQVFGDGPIDLIVAPGFVSHAEALWGHPKVERGLGQIASFSRVILFDKREQGLSDRVGRPPTLEEMVDDMRAVLDAAGSERAAVFGVSEGGAMAVMFAATHPARCSHLVLWGAYARILRGPDNPHGSPPEFVDAWGVVLERDWGGPVALDLFAPSMVGDPESERWWAHLLRTGTSPRGAHALIEMYRELDARPVLSSISAPTLVLHRSDDRVVPLGLGRDIAERIPGARFMEVAGADHLIFNERGEEIIGEVEEFLTGTRRARAPERALATVLFTDIVDSTAHATRLGDARWRELLDRHDALVRERVERGQGRVIKTTGDGCLATFDGPARAIGCAESIISEVRSLGLDLRAGLHCGECELRNGDVGGVAVHIGARVAALAGGGEVLTSGTVKDLVAGSGIEFEDRGSTQLRGVPGEWRLYAVSSRRA